ncbi:MAG: hypothetical protein PHF05_04930 [Candidatus Izemoplasmatales bacterium]|nr:hypothetical protein [Candidatus Izemoplasmatales bacterium]
MNRLLKKMQESKMTLIASLPRNDYNLAKLAWESGADAIKVHANVFHNASQNDFGSLADFKAEFLKILKDSPVPVGLVPGGSAESSEEVMDEIVEMGFDFLSLYAHHTPATFYYDLRINNFLSVNSSYSYQEISELTNNGYADMLELSIIDKEEYGTRLNARDLSKYQTIASLSDIPCVVPSQKFMKSKDVPLLYQTGVKAVMLGAVVFGKDASNLESALKAFRKEIDQL